MVTHFPQQGHTYFNEATPPNSAPPFESHFLSNHCKAVLRYGEIVSDFVFLFSYFLQRVFTNFKMNSWGGGGR